MLYTFYEDLNDYGLADLESKQAGIERMIDETKAKIAEKDEAIEKANSSYW